MAAIPARTPSTTSLAGGAAAVSADHDDTMAAIPGGLPLMLGTGTGSEIRQPLGYAIVGGLLVSQALTLFTTPVIYLYLDRVSERASAWWGRRKPHHVPETTPAE